MPPWRRWSSATAVLLLSLALHGVTAPVGAEAPADADRKGLATCLSGQSRGVCTPEDLASWRLVWERFPGGDVVFIVADKECEVMRELLEAALHDIKFSILCFNEDAVWADVRGSVDDLVARGWWFRGSIDRGAASVAGPADWLSGDRGYFFRSSFFQAYTRKLCAEWITAREEKGVQYDWVLFSRMDVQWRAFPEVADLESPHPLLWTHFRSLDMVAPHTSDRFHVGRAPLMKLFLENEFFFLKNLTGYVDGIPGLWTLLTTTCLERSGEARITCPPDFGSEDLVEFMCHALAIPYRMHRGICFNMLSTRFERDCSRPVENNCRALRLDEARGFVVEPSKGIYTHPYTWHDDYDNLLAIKLHRILVVESQALGRPVHVVDVGAGVGTYVSALSRSHPHVLGMDARYDLLDMLGDQGLLHDFTRPLPRILRRRFDWVFALNALPDLSNENDMLQFQRNIMDMARVGVIMTFPENFSTGKKVAIGFENDYFINHELELDTGLLCCRDWLGRTSVLRRTHINDTVGAAITGADTALEQLADAEWKAEVTKGDRMLASENSTRHGQVSELEGSLAEERAALLVGSDEDRLDYKVPGGSVVWGLRAKDLDPDTDASEFRATALYLKFFRLAIVDDEQFKRDLVTMDLDWSGFAPRIMELLRCLERRTIGSHVEPILFALDDARLSDDYCNKIWGTFEFLERVSARISCSGPRGCDEQSDEQGPPCTVQAAFARFAVAIGFAAEDDEPTSLSHAADRFLEDGIAPIPLRRSLAHFGAFQDLAGIARRCAYLGDWPPVVFEYEPGLRAVRSLTFAGSLFGKYMFRIHNAAGVRS